LSGSCSPKPIDNDPQLVAPPAAAPATEFQRRQIVAPAEIRHEKAMIENAAIVAVSTNHFECRTVPDEVMDRLHPALIVLFLFFLPSGNM
jgi:hypothetical protein